MGKADCAANRNVLIDRIVDANRQAVGGTVQARIIAVVIEALVGIVIRSISFDLPRPRRQAQTVVDHPGEGLGAGQRRFCQHADLARSLQYRFNILRQEGMASAGWMNAVSEQVGLIGIRRNQGRSRAIP